MKDIIYNSQYQNLHMDRANPESMKTVKISINTKLTSKTTPRLLYRYKHGYDYTPQVWGLWDIKYSSELGGAARRGYGYITHNTGAGLQADFYYTVDSMYVNLYFKYFSVLNPGPPTGGTKATFTGYVFANDRTDQDYT